MIMKKWNKPEFKELNINQTENGCIDSYVEFFVLNDDKKSCTPPEDQTS